MSRIGKAPVYFGKDLQVSVGAGNVVTIKGPKLSLSVKVRPEITVKVGQGVIECTQKDSTSSAFYGLTRALLQNAITGVSKGWSKDLELNGVGYRAAVKGKQLELTLGFSHPVQFDIPAGIEIKVDKQTKLTISGSDRQQVGQVASVIRSFRPPEPYLGKGVKYSDEHIRKKAGKAAGKA
jgi:large subunit ribosomal protein L6